MQYKLIYPQERWVSHEWLNSQFEDLKANTERDSFHESCMCVVGSCEMRGTDDKAKVLEDFGLITVDWKMTNYCTNIGG